MSEKPRMLYPMLIIAAIAVTILSLTGVAAIAGFLPKAQAQTDANKPTVPGAQLTQTPPPVAEPLERKHEGRREREHVASAAGCSECGTVESVRVVEHKGSGTGLGAVAGGVAGALLGHQMGGGNGKTVMTVAGAGGGAYLGNEIEKNAKKTSSYQIRVRMNDGSMRTLSQHTQPGVSVGDRVRVARGSITQIL